MAKKFSIRWEASPARAIARVERVKLLGKNTLQTAWPEFQSGDRLRQMIGVHDVESGEPIAEWSEDRSAIHVANQWIARLDENAAAALDLPPSTRLGLDLTSTGIPAEKDFRITRRFKNAAGLNSPRTIVGAFLVNGATLERLPSPLFELVKAAEPLRDSIPEQAERLTALDELTKTLGLAGTEVSADRFLEGLRVFYASGVSLSLRVEGDEFDFDPVLFGRTTNAESPDERIDEIDDSLLSEALQGSFLRDFRGRGANMQASALGSGAFVYFDPFVSKALRVISDMKASSKKERERFALNPRRAFKEAFADSPQDEEAIDRLFIQTDQFSDRVKSIDVWRAPILPWIKPRPNTWLPETFGFKVGERTVAVSPERAPELVAALEKAIQEGAEEIVFDDVPVPATSRSLEAARDIAALAKTCTERADETSAEGDKQEAPPFIKRFLVVDENYETVTYQLATADKDPLPFDARPPTSLSSTFKKHQAEGYRWLVASRSYENSGALLADDMGLGKTLQALAFLAWRKDQARSGGLARKPSLIVAPTALQDNWLKEKDIHFAAGAFGDVRKITGSYLKSIRMGGRDVDTGVGALDTARLRELDVLITTYETMRDYHLSFARLAFDVLILDEAQRIKNPASQVNRAAKALNAEFVLSLTGTPVENRLQDIWSVMDVTWPGKLGASKDFAQKFDESNLEHLRALNNALTQPDGRRPPVMLRRLKKDEIDGLPPKKEIKRTAAMPALQADLYTDIIRRVRAQKGPGVMLKALHQWRSVSLHPEPAPEFVAEEAAETISRSARFKLTFEILREIQRTNEKALVFLEDLEWQGWLANAIRSEFRLADNPPIINGSVPGGKRQAIVDRFQNDAGGFNVMILSPRAAGVGLTITAANHVIHLSRWWNPAVEDQATDRVYRIGQGKPVYVYIPQAEHPHASIGPASFDLKLDELMERKRSMSSTFLAPSDAGESELEAFFNDLVSVDIDTPQEARAPGDGREEPSKTDDRSRKRSTLTLRQMEASEARRDGDPLRVGSSFTIPPLAAGEVRPLEAAIAPLRLGEFSELWIEDPYFACDNVLEPCTLFFSEQVFPTFGKPEKLFLRCLDPDHPKVRNQMNGLGKHAVKNRICESFGMPVQFQFEGLRNKHFHDRSLIYVINSEHGRRAVRWVLPGGLEQWLDQKRPQQPTQQYCETAPRWTG